MALAALALTAARLLRRFYKGVVPLWMRQIPYTMMKFACFERTVETLYKYVVPKPRSECSKSEQLVVTFVAGYIGESPHAATRARTSHRLTATLCPQPASSAPSCPTLPTRWCRC